MARIPTQRMRHPKTGDECKVNYNDKENISRLRLHGYEYKGGVNEDGCVKYNIKSR